ncbi:lytic transglycosylase domain-containing protein [Leifsonia sp. NPDC058194]|uniref:lytic transglycosylase domain-containing protein n=1 Tax=Leifsonia sp. NPDC058194 TaxID=3346374 RepID=UPI0036D9F5A1
MRRLLLVAGAVAIAAVVGVCALSSAPAPRGWSVPPSDAVPAGEGIAGEGIPGEGAALADGAPGADSTAAAAPGTVTVTGGNASRVSRSWAADVARRTGIPLRAVLAYAGAATALAAEAPGCRLGWTTLAGLGAVESHHGTIGGSAPQPDGTVQPPILGPRLDGTDYDAIPDTDGGRYDGDARWDRAVGPFQFIPSTWEQWGADGSGDGVADPQQLDDAALTAGRYLCSYGDLSRPASWRSAIFAYNHLDSYVDAVAAAANAAAASARGASAG